MVTNLFIVESPLQLINATEASQHFGNSENMLVVRKTHNVHADRQISNLVSLVKWDDVIWLDSEDKSVFLKALQLIRKFLKRHLSVGRVFIGEFRSPWMLVFAENIKPQELFLLDDGAGTPIRQREDLDPENKSKFYAEQSGSMATLVKKILCNLLGLKYFTMDRQIHLYTFFELQPYEKQKVVHNDFMFLREYSKKHQSIDEDAIYFIGTSMAEIGVLSEHTYMSLLKKVLMVNSDKTIVYIPHRRECENKISEISRIDNVEVRRLENIVEYEFLFLDQIPSKILCFPTMAAFTLKKIFPSLTINMLRLNAEDINERYREATISNYKLYSNVVNLIEV